MLEILRNAWKVAEVRRRILYTLMMLLIFRIGSFVPTPFVDPSVLQNALQTNNMFGLLSMFNGYSSFGNFTVLAAGITPYITASIVIQLLTVAIPSLEKLMKEGGEEGRKKLGQYTRYSSIALAMIQTGGYMIGFGQRFMSDHSWYAYLTVLIVQAAGAAFAMWIGERVTEHGVGNGISLLIFVNILSNMPVYLHQVSVVNEQFNIVGFVGFLVMTVAIIAAVVYIDLGQRKIPVQYAKRMVGRKVYGGQSTHIPLKLNNSGVMPLIFAMTLVSFPNLILGNFMNAEGGFGNFARGYEAIMHSRSAMYLAVQALLILFFTYFYSQISFNPIDISKNIQQYGGFIPGIRPGKPTSDFLARLANRINLFSALFFMLLSLVPSLYTIAFTTGSTPPFGATSILILVGVALETAKQIEAQMLMRHYKGFLN